MFGAHYAWGFVPGVGDIKVNEKHKISKFWNKWKNWNEMKVTWETIMGISLLHILG